MNHRSIGPDRRVVITGIGAITPFGLGFGALHDGVRDGKTALDRAGAALPGAEDCTVGLVRDQTSFGAVFPDIRPPLPVAATRMALLAAWSTLTDAAWPLGEPRGDVGVVLNRNRGATSVVVKAMEPVLLDGPRKMSPLLFTQSVANAPIGVVATRFGLRGPHLLTSGSGALMIALDLIRSGEAHAILAGGLEEVEATSLLACEENGTISPRGAPEQYRPYAADAVGATHGEGAVMLLLEDEEHAVRRGARVHAELSAATVSLDTSAAVTEASLRGWGRPTGAGIEQACRRALAEAGIDADAIDAVIGGGNGVRAVDETEQEAMRRLHIEAPLQSLKGHIGDGNGMAAAASTAFAAALVARGESAASLVVNVEIENQVFAAVVRRRNENPST